MENPLFNNKFGDYWVGGKRITEKVYREKYLSRITCVFIKSIFRFFWGREIRFDIGFPCAKKKKNFLLEYIKSTLKSGSGY